MSQLPNIIASAETLINCAAAMVLDAAHVLKDAGDSAGVQRLEELATIIAAESSTLQAQREAITTSEVAA